MIPKSENWNDTFGNTIFTKSIFAVIFFIFCTLFCSLSQNKLGWINVPFVVLDHIFSKIIEKYLRIEIISHFLIRKSCSMSPLMKCCLNPGCITADFKISVGIYWCLIIFSVIHLHAYIGIDQIFKCFLIIEYYSVMWV